MGRVLGCHCLRRMSRATSDHYSFYSSKACLSSDLSAEADGFQYLCPNGFQNNALGFTSKCTHLHQTYKMSFPLSSLNLSTAQKLMIRPQRLSSASKGPLFTECPRFFSTKNQPNYYEVLGVKQSASAKDIRSAFLRLSKEYHPDLNKKDPNNHTKFVSINEAYSVLSKQLSRRDYDSKLTSNKTTASHTYSSTNPNSTHWGNQYEQQFREQQFHDPHFYDNRDKSKDQFYSKDSFYGVKGLKKQSDNRLVLGIILFCIFGVIIQGGIVWISYGMYKPPVHEFHVLKTYHDVGNNQVRTVGISDSKS